MHGGNWHSGQPQTGNMQYRMTPDMAKPNASIPKEDEHFSGSEVWGRKHKGKLPDMVMSDCGAQTSFTLLVPVMKPKPFLIVFCLNCFIYVSYAVNPACECVVYESYGRTQGTFTSPNFPQVYPPNVNCILYTFIGDLDEIVELTFLEFDVRLPTTNKCVDFLKFFLDLERPEVNEHNQWNYYLCGNITMVQKKHFSSTRSLILEFHTGPQAHNFTGFRGIFRFLDKAEFEIVGGTKRWSSQCTYDFYSNSNIKSKSGKFFSPKYPQNYPQKANCQYIFYGMPKERIKVIFQNIQLETIDGSCTDSPDSIIVRDGMDSSASMIAHYCNTMNDVEVLSTGSGLYIEFIADERKQRQGFAAKFYFIKADNVGPSRPSTLPTKSTPSSGPNTDSLGDKPPPRGSTPATTKVILTDCITEFRSSHKKNGTFSSPNYPHSYTPDTVCKYVFRGHGKERVQIIFTALDLSYPEGDPQDPYDCEGVDSVAADIKINGKPENIGQYCGSRMPPMLMSNDNTMEVVFTSKDKPSSSKGFQAEYRFVTNFGIPVGKQANDMVCGFTFRSKTAPNGTFTSPNFPGLYPRNTECHYLFYGEPKEKIYITFPYFDVEGIPPLCMEETQSDYVEFSNFNRGLQDRKMDRFCGTKEEHQTKTVNSDENFFRVTFKSNGVYDATGFEAFYQFRKYEDPFSPRRAGGSSCIPRLHGALVLLVALSWLS